VTNKNIIRVHVTCGWGEDSNSLLRQYAKQSPDNSCRWGNIEFVNNQARSDVILALDGWASITNPNTPIIFFGREPRHIGMKVPRVPGCTVYHHELGNSWCASTWWVGLDYDTLVKMSSDDVKKSKNLSIIDSGKTATLGHRNRVMFINQLVAKMPESIDIFGKITSSRSETCFKTTLPPKQKEAALLPYRYSLAIENGSTDYYFTEKLADPLLCWTMPIYWGCKKIESFFPPDSYIWVDIDKETEIDRISQIIKSDYREQNLDAIAEARNLILNKYNLFPTAEMAIREGKIL
jgi:hypothetical protein